MRVIFAAVLFVLAFAGVPAHALECVLINKPNFGTVTTVPTQNGTMWVIYQTNSNLPIRTVKLTDGTRVTGGLPGNIPMSFLYADGDNKMRTVRAVVMQYVPQANTQPGKITYYDPQDHVVFSDSISPTPAYQADTYFSPPLLSPIVKAEVTFPRALVLQYCVEPGDNAGMTVRQWLRGHRHH